MNDDYLDAFVDESEEMILELNNALLTLERQPDDRDAMDHIFRCAHTLKGNFGAVGYEEASTLAHAIEDLLDAIRDGRIDASADVMDVIFDGVDEVEAVIDAIQEDGESTVDPGPTIEAIRTLVDGADGADPSSAGSDGEATHGDATPVETTEGVDDDAAIGTGSSRSERSSSGGGGSEELFQRVLETEDVGERSEGTDHLFLAQLELSGGTLKGVDGMLALESIEESLDLVATVPGRRQIEDGEYDEGFDVALAGADRSEVESVLDRDPRVVDATVTALTDDHIGTGQLDPARPDASPARSGGESRGGSADATSRSGGRSDVKSIRVNVKQVDELYGLVEQLVTNRIKLRRSIEREAFDVATDNVDELDKTTTRLQNIVMDMRLIPLGKVVGTFPRMVRDLARDQEKQIDFQMEGTDVELDRRILDEIDDPLIHVLRNAVDHGIEPPGEREALDKPPGGTIRLRAEQKRDQVTITVEDDGRGLDVAAIERKALERGVFSEAELGAMSDPEKYELIFHPGFSTAEEVTDVSGRGVGMDVVHRTVAELDGSVRVESELGVGTTVALDLPVSVAIVNVLLITVDGDTYGIPIKQIAEITAGEEPETVHGEEVLSRDGEIYPVVKLDTVFADGGRPDRTDDGGMFIRIDPSIRKAALRCDAVIRQDEVVIKPFEGALSNVDGLSGTAVIGDGEVVPIIDVGTLSR